MNSWQMTKRINAYTTTPSFWHLGISYEMGFFVVGLGLVVFEFQVKD